MKLKVNGEVVVFDLSVSVEDLMVQFHCDPHATALAVNGSFVPRHLRDQVALKDGDEVELVVPMQGG